MRQAVQPLAPVEATGPHQAAAEAEPIVEIDALNKVYRTVRHGDVHALHEINLNVRDGEFVAIVGPSGCGKSTLLKILAGLLAFTSGRVTINGAPLKGPSQEVGLVFQQPVLLPWRTILSNVLLPIEFGRNRKRKDYTDRAHDLLKLVGLEGFETRYPEELSGGMQQRAAIVRALIQDPRLLLMDEPFGALDAMTREQMNLEVLRIWQQNRKTVIFVTHSISEAVFLADRVVVMTARPGAIARVLDIDLPRPRRLEMINSEAFGAFASQIRRLLNASEDLS
ncbi:ABC transporter ATP-binding protein [Roseospira goensis]|uniref:NitT/TauT family transport system ATP-binding protein n=1 Tax=Roseospira goensis TaxID=391922 RepID=A0A7W6RZU8_9PROT|nr:ABC transporter ATP-binding protein [Roseospira goensis]MBB4286283.1 NitT/TauT family transport system ATP-binding protein [Roseospira goensis]